MVHRNLAAQGLVRKPNFMQVELLCRVKRDRRPEHQMFVMTPPTGGLQNIASSVRLGSQQVRRLV